MPHCWLRNTNNLEGKVFHMEFEHIIELINAVSKSNLSTFTLEEGNMKITLGTKQPEIITKSFEVQNTQVGEYKVIQPVLPAEEALPAEKTEGHEITSPLVGTFYTSASPDAEPFVTVGTHVTKGQVLGIIEAMKLMNEIESDCNGVVEKILIGNEEMVEYGQTLFVIKEEA